MDRDWRALALVTQVGLTIAVTIVVSLLLGLWIDSRFGTKPWATLAFAMIGVFAALIAVYRMVSEAIDASISARDAGEPDERDRFNDDSSREGRKEDE